MERDSDPVASRKRAEQFRKLLLRKDSPEMEEKYRSALQGGAASRSRTAHLTGPLGKLEKYRQNSERALRLGLPEPQREDIVVINRKEDPPMSKKKRRRRRKRNKKRKRTKSQDSAVSEASKPLSVEVEEQGPGELLHGWLSWTAWSKWLWP